MHKFLRRFTFLLLVLILFSCGEYEALEIKKEASRVSDSLFRAHRDSLIKDFDQTCSLKRDSIYKTYFDSIRLVEAEKIRALIKK
jgi:hypothetical protein